MEERVHKRLAIEKCNIFLREGRRPTLIKSTLSNLPIYYVSIVLPKKVSSRIEKISRYFLWGGFIIEKTALGEIGDHFERGM